MATVNRAP